MEDKNLDFYRSARFPNSNQHYTIYPEAKKAVTELKRQLIDKKEAADLFGNEKDNSFEGTLQSVVRTFGGQLNQ